MKYDFSVVVNRRNTDSIKWMVKDNDLPMWIADMDFPTAPEIRKAIEERAKHGVFGYTDIPDTWYKAYQNWWKDRHNLDIEKDSLIFCTGVIPAISSTIRKLTTPAEKVLIQTPVYNIFFNSILNNGRQVIENNLIYKDGKYEIDFNDLEEKLSDPQTSLMILCNPHNPIGKIWDKETLIKIADLCYKHHVLVLSDEIHCDLTDPGCEYIPFSSVSDIARENSITCIAPTKAFNLAGIQTAAVVVHNPVLRHKVWRALNTDEVAEANCFAVPAVVAAYTKSGDWLDELRSYIFENKKLVRTTISKEIPELSVVNSDATYLLWLDCSKITKDANEFSSFIKEKTGLFVSAGNIYGSGGEKFLRMNVACPRIFVEDGLQRLKKAVALYKSVN